MAHGDSSSIATAPAKEVLPMEVYTASLPLVGGPSWLRLHQATVLKVGSSWHIADFLPCDPQAPSTVLPLLLGRGAVGELRLKEISKPPGGLQWRCSSEKTLGDVKDFNTRFDRVLRLLTNDCQVYVDSIIDVLCGSSSSSDSTDPEAAVQIL
eukprot:gnl/TRDRNA2_/TRDRNA2_153821_c1_seq1.p1 gnl/TRDRNA2_/TRDRNA2_153821_c1~~gnl/TRDRNA2_/TRDRNA2_153821_c1_seq1.p1  ORF type:complete len:176 (-),score=10.45 gnl/TRDRNA2_/TRDRNA2_153821_c1_seq1:48-506(-)